MASVGRSDGRKGQSPPTGQGTPIAEPEESVTPRIGGAISIDRSVHQRSSSGMRLTPAVRTLVREWLLRATAVAIFLGSWWAATGYGLVDSLFLPSPGEVVEEGSSNALSGELLYSAAVSTKRVLVGFSLAIVVGIPVGLLMGSIRACQVFLDPVVSLLRPLPSLTWIPLTMLWFGIGETQKYAIVYMGTIIYVTLYTMETTKRTDPVLIRAGQNLGASRYRVLRDIVLPASAPGIFSGLKVTLAIAWSCVLSAELVAASDGLGALIWRAKDTVNLPLVLVGMVSISVTVLVLDIILKFVEPRLFPWENAAKSR